MFHLVYASTSAKLLTSEELLVWLHHFREKNVRLGITGLLLYKDGAIMQALEGEEDAVLDLYDVIRVDQRHHHVETLLRITVPERRFPDWLMGFKNLEDRDVSKIQGYKGPGELPPWVDILPWKASVAMRLLAAFNEKE